MLEELQTLFFYQIRVRRWVGVSCSWVVRLFAQSMVVWCGLVSYEWSWSWSCVGNAGLDCLWYGLVGCQWSLILFEMWHIMVHSAWSPLIRLTFVDHLIAMYGIKSALKTFEGSSWLVWKKDFVRIFRVVSKIQLKNKLTKQKTTGHKGPNGKNK